MKTCKKFLSFFLAVLMLVSILPSGMIVASAASNPYPVYQDIDGDGYREIRCTHFAWKRAYESTKVALPGWGHAGTWLSYAKNAGYNVGSKPKANSIAVWTKGAYGHVAFVTKVNGSTMWVDEGGCISIDHTSSQGVRYGTTWYSTQVGSVTYGLKLIGFIYLTKDEVKKPSAPKITSSATGNIAVDSTVTVSWAKVSNATGYIVKVNGKQVQKKASTKYAFKASPAKKYEITVNAYNSKYTSGASNKIIVTSKNPSKVIFKDYDGTVLSTQTVKYGGAASSPKTPSREGYTFDGWNGVYNKVTQNLTVTATYKINTYIIKFIDRDGVVLSTQKVKYNENATPPSDTNAPVGYQFAGWNSKNYLKVKKNATIQGIYSWSNEDLPIVAKITSAKRQDDGYYIYFNLTNCPDEITRGRAVVALKTSEGKLIDYTESAAFSIPKGGTKNGMEVFVPCEKAATKAELVIVNSYSSGVPISESVVANIDQGKAWSAWSTTKPATGSYDELETRTEYRYRDKSTKTSSSKTMSGWTLYDTTSAWSSYGSWSSWSKTKPKASDYRKVESKTVTDKKAYKNYNYYYYRYWNSNYNKYYYTYAANGTKYTKTLTSPMVYYKTYDGKKSYVRGSGRYYNFSGEIWFLASTKDVPAKTHTEYRYADRKKVYTYHFYKWGNWSNWSTKSVSANSNKQVEKRTVYRYRSNDAGVEDTTGQVRTLNGKVDTIFAGKQATLFIYKVDEASDYSNEFVAQTVIGKDGIYNFTYKLREEPSIKTGDYTIVLGIEGTSNTTVIGTIEAPKPSYTVNFYDYNGNIIDTQTVLEGDSAEVPDAIDREGYTFTGWDTSTTNVKENIDVHPQYLINTYTVVFVNWETDQIDIKEFEYGDKLKTPDVEKKPGYNLTGWEGVEEDETIVTENMVVTAKYDKDTYVVTFLDFDGNVISKQDVEHGDSATAPNDLTEDDVIFLGWSSQEADGYESVTEDLVLLPQYIFKDTVSTPIADKESGVYTESQKVTLSCDTPNSVIFYTTDGTDPKINGNVYSKPIEITQHCQLRFVASALQMNDSEEASRYYCINNPNIPSDWMTYEELPNTVINNFDSYNMETEVGYRYKDIIQTCDNKQAMELLADGWIYNGSKYTEYTDWQDDVIEIDKNKPGFEIETQEADDTSVTKYQYSHYKYTDDNGDTCYSKDAIEGVECTEETIVLDNKLPVSGFESINGVNTAYYEYNNQTWYSQTKVNGTKKQYRSRYQVEEYFKWTKWSIESPALNEARDMESADVFRYYNKNNYIVNIENTEFEDETLIVLENDIIDVSQYDNINGYELSGLYLDNEFSQKFDLSKPITESMTLYAKYTPKSYSVVFQLEDGTIIDEQMVNYLEPATEPTVNKVEGYVFVGWDKTFDSITDNTIITAKYIPQNEYVEISSINRTNVNTVIDTSFQLNITISPEEFTDTKVIWESDNDSVATVNPNGLVTMVGIGTATITARIEKTNSTASCKFTVKENEQERINLVTSSILDIENSKYLRRIPDGANTVNELRNEFKNETLYFYNMNGRELNVSDKIGTGTAIQLKDGNTVLDEVIAVMTGDYNGDGNINSRDVSMLMQHTVDLREINQYQAIALDVNGDGKVNNRDSAILSAYLVGKADIA